MWEPRWVPPSCSPATEGAAGMVSQPCFSRMVTQVCWVFLFFYFYFVIDGQGGLQFPLCPPLCSGCSAALGTEAGARVDARELCHVCGAQRGKKLFVGVGGGCVWNWCTCVSSSCQQGPPLASASSAACVWGSGVVGLFLGRGREVFGF